MAGLIILSRVVVRSGHCRIWCPWGRYAGWAGGTSRRMDSARRSATGRRSGRIVRARSAKRPWRTLCETSPRRPTAGRTSSSGVGWSCPGFVDTRPQGGVSEVSRCHVHTDRMQLSSAGGWSTWSGPAGRQNRSARSSSRRPRRFATGCAKPIATRADGRPDDRRARRVAPASARQCPSPRGAGDFEKSRGLVRSGDRRDPLRTFAFMKAHRAAHSIATLCRVLEVSPSGYYAWHRRTPSPRGRRMPR